MNKKELDVILADHKKWMNGEGGKRADLQGAYLRSAYLQGADLRRAYLRSADLQGANLCGANLCGAYLQGADLQGAYLRSADLCGAYLQGANLCGAYLQGADLCGAYLQGADLRRAYLRSAKNIPDYVDAITKIVPETGAFEAWKKLKDNKIAHLLIPADAKRSNATGRKCRASKAEVIEIIDKNTGEKLDSGISTYDDEFIYTVGQTVEPKQPFDDDRWEECGSGIHFFITRWEAENY